MFRIFLIAAIFSSSILFAEEKVKTDTGCCPKSETMISYGIKYTKRSLPQSDDNYDLYKHDGNNFGGITIAEAVKITRTITVGYNLDLQAGNIDGLFSFNVGLMPVIRTAYSDFGSIYFGAGVSLLSTDKNGFKNGGIGIASCLGIDLIIYKGFGFNISGGYEGYGHRNYITSNVGIIYQMGPK